MTLFIDTPTRRYQISDIYVMIISFLIFFAVGKIIKSIVEKQKEKRKENSVKTLPNPRGGSFTVAGVEIGDNNELAETILSCIADNERYLVKDPELRKVIFGLVRAKLENESLTITPNMIRFLALKLIKNDQSLIIKAGNFVVSLSNRTRLIIRFYGAAGIALMGAFFSVIPQAIFMMLLFFDSTEYCGYRCDNYFKNIPKDGEIARVYTEKSAGYLTIAENDDARQMEIYTPSKAQESEIVSNNGEIKKTKTYKKSKKKAKEVKFSDFRLTDPVLSAFENLEEPYIPQKPCPVNDHHRIIDIIEDL